MNIRLGFKLVQLLMFQVNLEMVEKLIKNVDC